MILAVHRAGNATSEQSDQPTACLLYTSDAADDLYTV